MNQKPGDILLEEKDKTEEYIRDVINNELNELKYKTGLDVTYIKFFYNTQVLDVDSEFNTLQVGDVKIHFDLS